MKTIACNTFLVIFVTILSISISASDQFQDCTTKSDQSSSEIQKNIGLTCSNTSLKKFYLPILQATGGIPISTTKAILKLPANIATLIVNDQTPNDTQIMNQDIDELLSAIDKQLHMEDPEQYPDAIIEEAIPLIQQANIFGNFLASLDPQGQFIFVGNGMRPYFKMIQKADHPKLKNRISLLKVSRTLLEYLDANVMEMELMTAYLIREVISRIDNKHPIFIIDSMRSYMLKKRNSLNRLTNLIRKVAVNGKFLNQDESNRLIVPLGIPEYALNDFTKAGTGPFLKVELFYQRLKKVKREIRRSSKLQGYREYIKDLYKRRSKYVSYIHKDLDQLMFTFDSPHTQWNVGVSRKYCGFSDEGDPISRSGNWKEIVNNSNNGVTPAINAGIVKRLIIRRLTYLIFWKLVYKKIETKFI
ncbi:hypothetical protein OAB57_01075 [Bacteriovoracaceae bacterium]|nr:hypothetical protein [Bacteriovoracaceae bacterium]